MTSVLRSLGEQRPPSAVDGHVPELPRVLQFIDTWLRPSEQFVHSLVTRLRHPPVVMSSLGVENVDRFPVSPLISLDSFPGRLPLRLRPAVVTAALVGTAIRHRVRLVHVHHGYRLHEVVSATRLLRLPIVVSLHGHDVTGYIEDHPTIYRGVLDRVSAAIVPSRFLADLAVAAGCRPDSVRVIPSGVDTSWFSPTPLPDGPPVVLFVGRFVGKKGLDVLLDSWREVSRAVPDARLRLLGFGPLEALARSAGPEVEVVIAPTHSEVREAMRQATVVASPSRTAPDDAVESLLIVNLEAQASGRPVVTTAHGAIPEFVEEGRSALLVPEADSRALAEALISVLCDRRLSERLAAAGPSVAKRFDAAECAARVDDLYETLI